MRLRALQIRQLSQSNRQRFLASLAAHLRTRFPQQTAPLPEGELERRLQETIDEAAAYGVRIEDDVRRFAEYRMIFGWDFPTAPAHGAMYQILRAKGHQGTAKMDMLDDHVTFTRARA